MKLFEQLSANTLLLTPNRRLAATFLKKYHHFQLSRKKTCWPTLDILPFSAWLQRTWHEFATTRFHALPILLTPQQEQIIWEELLQKSSFSEYLLQLSATAELAKTAWGILKQWRVELNHPLLKMTEDSRAFLEWATEFQTRCHQNHFLDTHCLADMMSHYLHAKQLKVPQQIILVGFTEFTPQQHYLLTGYAEAGSQIIYYESPKRNNIVRRIELKDETSEIETMARWAKKMQEKNHAYIGCVIPDLEKSRERILQIFSEVFSESHTYTLDPIVLPFNISAGKSLTSYPIIHTALTLLNLRTGTLSHEIVSYLLRSPFLGNAEQESQQRAQFDYYLKTANITLFSIESLLNFRQADCPALFKRFQEFQIQLNNINKTHPASVWVKIFMELLKTLGWPGERSLNSAEYQVVQSWLNVLTQYQTLDAIIPPHHYQTALHHLTQLAAKTIFQPQSPEAPVQILGMLEAAELPFDYLWISGLDNTAWPPAAKPNPFLPLRLQKLLQMPHANADRELLYSMQLMQQLKESANTVIFSYARNNKETECQASMLLHDIEAMAVTQLELSEFAPPAEIIFCSQSLESIYDENGPSLLPHEKIVGGVNIFKQQAACPFKAFAEIRLHARPIEIPSAGLREQDRGTIVHKALELIWQELKNSEVLAKIEKSQLKNLIKLCCSSAIETVTHQKINSPRYLQLELQRLENLLWNWLQLEKQRPSFAVISKEQNRAITLGNLTITIRVDRIDELADKRKLIIDYKTGKNNLSNSWLGERPDEPQLPLYCISETDPVASIAFAHVRATQPGFEEIKLEKNKSWEQQRQEWQLILEKIGNEFHHGKAHVDPKYGKQTCRYCHLKGLCRIDE